MQGGQDIFVFTFSDSVLDGESQPTTKESQPNSGTDHVTALSALTLFSPPASRQPQPELENPTPWRTFSLLYLKKCRRLAAVKISHLPPFSEEVMSSQN